jgi:hypothetical protein
MRESNLVHGLVLGETKVKDRLTGLEGTAMTAIEYSTEGVEVGILPSTLHDGVPHSLVYIQLGRIETMEQRPSRSGLFQAR